MPNDLDFSLLEQIGRSGPYLLSVEELELLHSNLKVILRRSHRQLQRHIDFTSFLEEAYDNSGDFRRCTQDVPPDRCPCNLCNALIEKVTERRNKRIAERLAEKNAPKKPRPGFVYVLKSGQYYKIGMTRSVPQRISELSIHLPEGAELIHYFPSNFLDRAEIALHQKYSESHKNGEWFSLTQEQIEEIKLIKEMKFQ